MSEPNTEGGPPSDGRSLRTLRVAQPERPLRPYPDGWFMVARSGDLGRRTAIPLSYFGRELVAYRDGSGTAVVADAFCPHVGAHLGHGGQVVDGELQCPFHHWRFGEGGRCTHVPYAPRPARVGLHHWPVDERNGLIWVFYHAEGAEPDYRIPDVEEATEPGWSRPLLLSARWNAHPIESQENFLDEGHFNPIHGQEGPMEIGLETDGPFASATTRLHAPVLGPRLTFEGSAQLAGPGFSVIRARGLISMAVMCIPTPIDEERTEFRLLVIARNPGRIRLLGAVIAQFLRAYTRLHFRREGEIWHRRTYHRTPSYSSLDKALPRFRRWYMQFCGQSAGPPE